MAHYYELNDEGIVLPQHFVPMASRPDESRPTRITDVRKWWKQGREVVPSVTTVLDVLNKWGLNNWKIDQHLVQAFSCPAERDLESWIAEIKRRTEMEMDKAPSAGTDFHAAIEAYAMREPVPDGMEELCSHVWHVTNQDLPSECDYEMEVRFVSRLGYGGCADLVTSDPRQPWVIDYKTKQTADKFKPGKMAFDEHRMQLASYREGLEIPNARAANVFVCLETGEVDFHEHTESDLHRGWDMFRHALSLWKIQNSYPEAKEMEAA